MSSPTNPIMEGMTALNTVEPSTSDSTQSQIPMPDQSAPTPQAPQASPDQSQQPTAPQKPSLWKGILAGALQGLAAGASVNTRGMSSGSAFAAGAGAGANQILNVVPQQNAQLDQAKAQAAFAHANASHIMSTVAAMNEAEQNKYIDQAADHADEGFKSGAYVPVSNTPFDNYGDAQQALHAEVLKNPWEVATIAPVRGADGEMQYTVVKSTRSPLTQDWTIAGGGADGKDLTIPKGTPADAAVKVYLNNQSKKLETDQKTSLQNDKIAGQSSLQDKKNAASAAKAAADAVNWLPKVSADEKKKTELAENIAFNANEVSSIIMRRKDLFGPAAGRITNIEQMMGNNDPDISALATHIHNMAMANSGVHGFRSQEGVESYEKQLLNNFRNGPAAVAGALRASVGSVQTFIDNARPRTYRTHSANGGAIRGMMNQGGN